MIRLLRSAFIIGRRDFAATVFSKAFIFFLIGPLFPVLLGALFGGIGARVATQAEHSRVAVVSSGDDFARLSAAREQLGNALGGRQPVGLIHVQPSPDQEAQTRALLRSRHPPVVAVLSGGNFVVTWSSKSQDGSGWGVYAQRFDAAGVAQGGEFQVNTYITTAQALSSVAT